MTKKNYTEIAKPETTTPNAPFPVSPTRLRAKTGEFCNEFTTIQLLKKRSMTTTGATRKHLLEQEINARKTLLMVFQTQVEFLLADAVEKTSHELD